MTKTKRPTSELPPVWLEVPFTMRFDVLRGGVPKNPALLSEFAEKRAGVEQGEKTNRIEGFLDMQKPGPRGLKERQRVNEMKGGDGSVRTIEQMAEALTDDWPSPDAEEMDRMGVGFLADTVGIYVRGGQLRAHFKQAAESLGSYFHRAGLLNFKANFVKRFYIKEDRIHVRREGAAIAMADGYCDHMLHVMTAMGPRNCLKRVDELLDVSILGTAMVLNDDYLDEGIFRKVVDYGMVQGAFQDRSLQYGRYTMEYTWPSANR